MTETFRGLERRAKASGSIEDTARVLAARIRRGEDGLRGGLTLQRRVELSAYVGGKAARLVLNEQERWGFVDVALDVFARGLSLWGQAVCVRASVAASRVALERQRAGHCKGDVRRTLAAGDSERAPCTDCGLEVSHDARPRQALDVAQAWLNCPCEEHREVCRLAMNALGDTPWFGILYVVAHWKDGTNGAAVSMAADSIERSAGLTSKQAVRSEIREALVAWALC